METQKATAAVDLPHRFTPRAHGENRFCLICGSESADGLHGEVVTQHASADQIIHTEKGS